MNVKYLLFAAALGLASPAFGQSQEAAQPGSATGTATIVLDQVPSPAPNGTVAQNSEEITQAIPLPTGTLYITTLDQGRGNGSPGLVVATSSTFAPGASSSQNLLRLGTPQLSQWNVGCNCFVRANQ